MKKIIVCFSLMIVCIGNAQVGIGTQDPQATLHVVGDIIVEKLDERFDNYIVTVNENNNKQGLFGKISINDLMNNLLSNSSEQTYFNQSEYGRLSGTEVIGRMFLNNKIKLNPTSNNIYGTNTGNSDNELAGKLKPGKHIISFDIRLFNKKLNKTSYLILRTIDLKNNEINSSTVIIPEDLDVGIELPYQMTTNCKNDCMIQIYRVDNELQNNAKIKFKYIN